MLITRNLSPLQRVGLRFAVVSLVFYLITILEGMLMRVHQISWDMWSAEHYYSIMTAHPLVGIFGSSYLLVFGAFYFLVPTLMKKEIYSQKMAEFTWVIMTIGVAVVWGAGFFFNYGALYTSYWPLPVDFKQFAPIATASFSVGAAFIMVGVIVFCYNLFATVLSQKGVENKKPVGKLLMSALGIDGFINIVRRLRGKEVEEPLLSLPVVAIFRGTVDTILDAAVLTAFGVVFLVHAVFFMATGNIIPWEWLDPLIAKNVFWWGLDLIADGLVLIYVAGTWYLLATLITGKKLFMQNIARAALLIELVVSWNVWGHHLLADQGQPNMMKILSGEMVTAFELVTMGIAIFITLKTLWDARPLKMTPQLMFLLGGILGFSLGVPAGIIQADIGMNRILHNTQWVIGIHAHMQLLAGLGMTLYAALYALWPLLTNDVKIKYPFLTVFHFWGHLIGSIGMAIAMGYAGMNGMLRRHNYVGDSTFSTELWLTLFFGILMVLSFLAMLFNLVSSMGLRGTIEIFIKLPGRIKEQVAPSKS